MLRMHNVSSSNINSVGYENGDLYVEFSRRNTLYVYHDVPQYVFKGLITASSPGEYLDEYVKKPGYRYEKIG